MKPNPVVAWLRVLAVIYRPNTGIMTSNLSHDMAFFRFVLKWELKNVKGK
jgi:hypothetical protein